MKKEARCGKPDQVHEAEVVNIGDSAGLGTQQQESVSSPDATQAEYSQFTTIRGQCGTMAAW